MQERTLADIFHLQYGSLLSKAGFTALEDGTKPSVARWWKDISSIKGWAVAKDAVTVEDLKV